MQRKKKLYSITDLKRGAAAFGATVEEDGGGRWRIYQCVAPEGKQWSADGAHAFRVEWMPGLPDSAQHRSEVVRDAIDRMEAGLTECPDDCDCRD